MSYSVKGVKSFTGREGYGFECSLYDGPTRVARVLNEANGASNDYFWTDTDKELTEVEIPHPNGKTIRKKCTPNEAKFLRYIQTFSDEPEAEDMFVAQLVDDYENRQRLKRHCRDKTLFRKAGDENGAYRVIRSKYSPQLARQIRQEYNDVEEIVNERFG